MMGTFEVTAMKDNKRVVKYYTVVLKNGIANTIYKMCKRNGYVNIDIRLI